MRSWRRRPPSRTSQGGAAIGIFAEKADNGVEMIYHYFDGTAAGDTGEPDGKRGTLTTDDLALPWHGEAPDGSA